jgi:adenylyltransferase/sulfurtransferase
MTEITPQQLREQIQQHDVFLLDVREPYEHKAFNIGGQLIPLGNIISMVQTIPVDKPVIVYCKRGVRSQIAIQRLEDRFGFTNLINLKGGMDAWNKEMV